MKTIIVKILAFALVIALCFVLFACEVSSYSAFMMVRSGTANKFEMSFGSLSGSISQNLSNSYTQDTTLTVEASLEEGTLEIYYKPGSYDEYILLCKLEGEDSVSLSGAGYLTNGESVRIKTSVPEGMTAKGGKLLVSIDNPEG